MPSQSIRKISCGVNTATMASLLITAILTVVIIHTVFHVESVPAYNCINDWSLNIEGPTQNETVVEYSQKIDPKSSAHLSWHWKSKKDGGKWTSIYTRTFNRGRPLQHGTFYYQNSITNYSARLIWELTADGLSWKSTGDKVIFEPAWNITVCDNVQWGFLPGLRSADSWSFHVGNTTIHAGEKYYKKTHMEYIEKEYNREKRQTESTYPRNVIEWFSGVVNDIFGTRANSRTTNKCTLFVRWLDELFNIGRTNRSMTSSTTTTENPDSEYLDLLRRRDVETVTESRNKRPRIKPKRLSEEYNYYY